MAAWARRGPTLRPNVLLLGLLLAALGGAVFLLRPMEDPGVPPDGASDGDRPPTRGPAAVAAPATAAEGSPRGIDDTSGSPAPSTAVRWVVSGHVLAAGTRAPVVDAVVGRGRAPHPGNLGPTEGFDPSASSLARSDATGAFRLELDAGAPVELSVEHPAWRRGQVTIDGSRTDEVVLLRPGLAVAGRVVARDGAAIEGAQVRPHPDDRDAVERPVDADVSHLTTDRDGRFRLVVDPKAPGSITVSHLGHVRQTVRLESAMAADVIVLLRPALTTWLRLRPDDRRRVPSVWVSWASSAQSATALVGETPPGPDDPPRPPEHVGPVEIPLDDLGTAVSLRVTAPGYLPFTTELAPRARGGDGRTLEVPLERDPAAGTVTLRVEDAGGAPVGFDAALPITVERTDGAAVPALAIAKGGDAVWAIDGVPAGPYRLRVWPGLLGPAEVEVTAVAGTTVAATARAPVEARLRLRVTGTKGRRALVRVLSGGRAAYPRIVEDPSGKARAERVAVSGIDSLVILVGEEGLTLGGLGAGRHRVEVLSPDVAAAPVEVELQAGETVAAEIAGSTR